MLLSLASLAFAYSTGRTGSSIAGCTPCHSSAADPGVTGELTASELVVEPGASLSLVYTISSLNAGHNIGGLNVSASGGTLVPSSGTVSTAGEITHNRDQHFSSSGATWAFTWTAPGAEGSYTLYSAGLAGDHSNSATGDGWGLDTVTVTVDDGCDDFDIDGYEACDDGTGADCDDDDATISPTGAEICDGVDQNCDGQVDEHPTDGTPMWRDVDEDGYGAGAADSTCGATADVGYVFNEQDCDDVDDTINPDATEVCDTVDNDCDGTVDGPTSADASTFYADADADGYGDLAVPTQECSLPTGYAENGDDCDDTRALLSPAQIEVCDSLDLDEDCDGLVDDADSSVTDQTTWYQDADADAYGGSVTTAACSVPSGYVAFDGDCDDSNSAFNPAASETCDDPTDYNCDGATGYVDGDGDGYAACDDCDDAAATTNAGATEYCNTTDDDCDGTIDEIDAADAAVWFVDADADGWGSTNDATVSCAAPNGYAATATDCDDTAEQVRPDAPEVWYDGVDQDCDGADDDQDGDGFDLADDCNDTDATIHPGAPDVAYDGLDADCAEDSDYDADGDGHDSESYGGEDCDDANASVYPGAPDEPYDGVIHDCDDADEYDFDGDGAQVSDDCDDANSAINPDADEIWYDGVDQDCDGNDGDQDEDGVALEVDCDDLDPLLALSCDTGGEDTGTPAPKPEPGCACASTSGVGALAGVFALAMIVRRRR